MRYIGLSKNLVAKVSDEDYERVSQFKWCASAQGRTRDRFYAVYFKKGDGKRIKVWLHRFVMGLPDSLEGIDPLVVDHKDGDGLNCQRDNLRVVTWSQNLALVNSRKKLKKAIPCEPWL